MPATSNSAEDARTAATERLLRAPVDIVFRAFSDPVRLARWWGPKGFSNSFTEFNLREGGYWRFMMHGPDGRDYPNESRFMEVTENRRVVIEHLSNYHFVLSIEFIASGEDTLVRWRQRFDTPRDYRQIADVVSQANEQNLDRLAEVVDELMGRAPREPDTP